MLNCAGLKIPKFDVTEHVKVVDAEFDPLLKSAAELEAFSQKRSKEIQEEIKGIDAEMVLYLCPFLMFKTSCDCMLASCSNGCLVMKCSSMNDRPSTDPVVQQCFPV